MHLNCPTWLEKNLEFTHNNWPKMHLIKLPTIWLEKIWEFTHTNWATMHLNCSPWLEKILEFTALVRMSKNSFKLSTMVGENFEISCSHMAYFPGFPLNFKIFQEFSKICLFFQVFQVAFPNSRYFLVFPGSGHPVITVG